MRKSRFTGTPIVSILREHVAGTTIVTLGRKYGVHPNTVFAWKFKIRRHGSERIGSPGANSMLERVDVALEASVELYREGRALAKQCEEMLAKAQERIEAASANPPPATQNRTETASGRSAQARCRSRRPLRADEGIVRRILARLELR